MIREGSRSAKFHTVIDGRRDPALYFANVIKAATYESKGGILCEPDYYKKKNGDYKYDISLVRVILG